MVNYVKIMTILTAMSFGVAFCITILSGMFPASAFDENNEEFQSNQASFESFAGNLALEYNAYILLDVRSPGYSIINLPNPIPKLHPDGDSVGNDRYYEGSIYGDKGVTNPNGVFLDPSQKSSQRLGNSALGFWTHTGYRYIFAPAIDSPQDQQVNLIWYKFSTDDGLDAGVDISVLDKRFSYLPAVDIINNYDTGNQVGEYKLVLGDRSVYVILKFNETVLQENGGDYYQTWDDGGWSINLAKKILADPADVTGSLVDMLLGILQMNNPNLPGMLNILLFLMITIPGIITGALLITEFLPFFG